ncbi:hypothetical protein C5C42_05955 [Rathayibacter sp. AY1F7]|nr:hypothetical protein C5C54_07680 [Rathayibacter sp. AY1F2]PPH46889.1 hypothetical protein C5C42_05955 [Rathayibacter sp. AY1F7]
MGTPRRQGGTTEELLRGFAAVLVLSLSVQRNAFAKSRLAGFSALLAIAGRMAAVRRRSLSEFETPFLGWMWRAVLRPRCVRELLDQARAERTSRSDAHRPTAHGLLRASRGPSLRRRRHDRGWYSTEGSL